ncbi:glycosyltransferase family 4 protein [Shimia sp.]|jgi:phosphatidylinositol alpha-mannosyltransferase|uniref:glycosyltransferase family 4 protein n=1 Tax=unclassified Shimia TaxID=2630038 RepID=UPI0025E37BA4|nr:glycosyltransferase family 4 protein [Shimia sp.]MCH2067846.1 glycosyltransferase family 4 protein [Shimia sp.]
MKIVQLTPYAMDRPGGVQSNIRDLAAWCRTQGHEVRIVAPPGNPAHKEEGLMTVGSARPWSIHGTSFEVSRATRQDIKTAVSELRDWGAEVIHMHTPWTPLLPWQMWRALKLPSIATFHATLPEGAGFDPMSAALRRVGHYFNRSISRVVVPSMAPFRQWEAAGANPVPVILPPSIDLSDWRAAGESAKPSKAFRVVYMGRLEARKGVSVLLDAWHTVTTAVPNAELIIAGAGEEEPALRLQAANLPNITFKPPPSDAEARALIASADVFAAPALHGESFGLVLIEAMAAGTLPVAAANEGFATVMTGIGADLLVPPGDAAALAQTLINLANDPDNRARLSKWASKHAMEFDVATVGPEYVKLYAQALAAPT